MVEIRDGKKVLMSLAASEQDTIRNDRCTSSTDFKHLNK